MRKRTTGEKVTYKENPEPPDQAGASRREFLTASAVGLAAVAVGSGTPVAAALTASTGAKDIVRSAEPPRKLLKGGIVLTLESTGDFEKGTC